MYSLRRKGENIITEKYNGIASSLDSTQFELTHQGCEVWVNCTACNMVDLDTKISITAAPKDVSGFANAISYSYSVDRAMPGGFASQSGYIFPDPSIAARTVYYKTYSKAAFRGAETESQVLLAADEYFDSDQVRSAEVIRQGTILRNAFPLLQMGGTTMDDNTLANGLRFSIKATSTKSACVTTSVVSAFDFVPGVLAIAAGIISAMNIYNAVFVFCETVSFSLTPFCSKIEAARRYKHVYARPEHLAEPFIANVDPFTRVKLLNEGIAYGNGGMDAIDTSCDLKAQQKIVISMNAQVLMGKRETEMMIEDHVLRVRAHQGKVRESTVGMAMGEMHIKKRLENVEAELEAHRTAMRVPEQDLWQDMEEKVGQDGDVLSVLFR
jgi:hypothetical protein